MAGFKIEQFRGERPRISATKLPRGEAQTAQNVKLGSGDIEPIPDKSTVQAVDPQRTPRTIYLFDNDGSPIWFQWNDRVNVVPGPVKDDSLQRTYYTGDSFGNGSPKLTTNQLADQGGGGPYPEDWWYIGVPAPVSAPTVTAPLLPEDKPSDERQVGNDYISTGVVCDSLVITQVKWSVYPGAGHLDTWEYDTASSIPQNVVFELAPGQSFRVTEVINANKFKVESATEPGVVFRTLSDDTTDWQNYTEMQSVDSIQKAQWIGFAVPVGAVFTVPEHRLTVGDVITATVVRSAPTWMTFTDDVWYEQNWSEPVYRNLEDEQFYAVANAEVTMSAVKGDEQMNLTCSFYYDVDRAASDVSELEERSYVYTYVNSLGEEGPPSPPSPAEPVLDGSDVVISELAVPPSIGYDIIAARLYRTNSTEAGTEYQFVKEIPILGNFTQQFRSTTDNIVSAELGEVISTTTWDPPDPQMKGLIALPNGMLAGFNGKQVYFCEPYFPHAWPPEYDQAIDYNVVGLAALGNSLIVLTEGWPYLATGSHPRNMNLRPVKVNQACVSAESIAAAMDKVYYASPDGLVEVSLNGVNVITEGHFDKEEWQQLSPETMVGEFYEGRYYGFYDFQGTPVATVISAELSGTITAAEEPDIINGGLTILITLTNDLWVTEGAAFNAQRQNIIDGLTASTSQTLGWNNQVRDIALQVANVVRTSDSVVTVTLPAAPGYAIDSLETIECTVPATALQNSNSAVVCGSTFDILPQLFAASVSIGGTADGSDESDIVTGGETVTLTVTGDTWESGATFDAQRQAIIDGLFSTTNQPDAWNDSVPQLLSVTDVVRTSDTVVTITLPAIAAYDIVTDEQIRATVPHEALVTQQDIDVTTDNSIGIIAVGVPSALFGGSATAAMTENEVIAGGKVLTITLTNDTWIAAGTGPIGSTAQSQSIIDALVAATSPTNGWNNVVVPGIEVSDLVRTSATVATITLDPESTYSIAENETISMIIPNDVLVTSTSDLTVANTFSVTAQAPVTAVLSGTVTSGFTELDVVAGGDTIILTLSNDTWVASGATFDGQRQNIIDGLVSDGSELNGWDNELIGTGGSGSLDVTDVVRTSDTVVTITLPADAQYNITANETITATIPATALEVSASAVVASPTFTVTYDVPATVAVTGTLDESDADHIRTGGKTLILTVSNDTWVAAGATFNAQRQNIIDGLDAASSPTNGWNNEVRDGTLAVTDVVRTSDTVVTVTLPATANYDISVDEVITVTVPASALVESTVAVVGTPTVDIRTGLNTEVMVTMLPDVGSFNDYPAYADFAQDSYVTWDEDLVADLDGNGRDTASVGWNDDATNKAWVIFFNATQSGNSAGANFWRSTDDGDTWLEVYDVPWNGNPSRYGPVYSSSNDIWMINIDFGLGWYYSTDGGQNWTLYDWVGTFSVSGYTYFVEGGANYFYSGPRQTSSGPYDWYAVRTDILNTGSPMASDPTEFQLSFDGSIDTNASGYGAVSGNGKIIYWLVAKEGINDYMYLSYVTHGQTTENYIGKIALNTSSPFWISGYVQPVFDGTQFIIWDGNHRLRVRCDADGSETTIGNWTFENTQATLPASTAINYIFYDPGATGGDGMGLTAVGYNYSSGDPVLLTSSDSGASWTTRHTFTASALEEAFMAASKTKEDTA